MRTLVAVHGLVLYLAVAWKASNLSRTPRRDRRTVANIHRTSLHRAFRASPSAGAGHVIGMRPLSCEIYG